MSGAIDDAAPARVAREHATTLALLEGSTDAFVALDVADRVTYLNARAKQLFGDAVTRGEIWPPNCLAAPGESREVELTGTNGALRTFELTVHETRWDETSVLLLCLRDITERRAAEQALMLLRRAVEASSQGMVIADANEPGWPLIYVNPAFEHITGYSRGEAIGRGCGFLQGHETDQPQLHALHAALRRGEGANVVLRNYRKNGSAFWNELAVSPVRGVEGTVTHFVGIVNDVSERHRLEEDRLQHSTHDALTGLPNRKMLLALTQQAMEAARQRAHTVALLLLHLMHAEEVTDAHGHEAGEQLLLEVVARIKRCLRPGEMLARLSDYELVVLVPDLVRAEEAASAADRLLEMVCPPRASDEVTPYGDCSVGVAIDEGGNDAAALLQQASIASHSARRTPHKAVDYYSDEIGRRLAERQVLRASLRGAVGRGEFTLHYQPQLDVQRQCVSGVEALLRWHHPTLGEVSPTRFIPVAEEIGMIVPIGEWVMEQACRQHRRWLDRGLLDCAIAVNVSGVQFQRDDFVDVVCDVLRRSGLPPNRLELELTESVTMDTGAETLMRLHRLRALGITLSIDDFGTGFSSLGYLKRLPIDKVKIDRSFVKDITRNADDAAITLSIVSIAQHLRLRVVAEGVETQAQLAFLKRHACDEIQGFLVSRPLEAAQVERFLESYVPPRPSPDECSETARAPTLLLVDDEPNILRALTRLLRRDGYRVLTADGAAAAFDLLAQHEVHVILSDQRMPRMCGTDFLSEVKSLYPQTVRIVLSGQTDLQTVTRAINEGAVYRFLTKPWEDDALRMHIKEAFRHRQLVAQGVG